MEQLTLTPAGLPGEPVEIPYVRIQGRAGEGPHLTVVAGVHGCEYTGMAAVMRLIARLDPGDLRGTVTAVPILNQPAFWSRSAFVVPADGKNLNRCFPGDPAGSYTDVLAHEIFSRIIAPSDYLLDLHAGDLPEALEPFACTRSPRSRTGRAGWPWPTVSGTWCGRAAPRAPSAAARAARPPTSGSPPSSRRSARTGSATRRRSSGTCAGCSPSAWSSACWPATVRPAQRRAGRVRRLDLAAQPGARLLAAGGRTRSGGRRGRPARRAPRPVRPRARPGAGPCGGLPAVPHDEPGGRSSTVCSWGSPPAETGRAGRVDARRSARSERNNKEILGVDCNERYGRRIRVTGRPTSPREPPAAARAPSIPPGGREREGNR